MQPWFNRPPLRAAAQLPCARTFRSMAEASRSRGIARITAVLGIVSVLGLGFAGQLRSQTPADDKWVFDDAWGQCLQAATRACVLRYAARVAESIEDPRPDSRLSNVSSRVEHLASVAEAQFEAALETDAAATLERARQLVASIAGERDGGWGDMMLGRIVAIQARAGKLDGALELARSIGKEIERAEAIGRVAAVKGEAGSIAEALELVQAIDRKSVV